MFKVWLGVEGVGREVPRLTLLPDTYAGPSKGRPRETFGGDVIEY